MTDASDAELLSLLSPGLFPAGATEPLPALDAPEDAYGLDLVCLDDLEADGAEVAGLPQLAQDNYHRVNTRRGKIPGYPNDGIDIAELLSKGLTPAVEAAIPGLLRTELLKDKRNRDVRVTPSREGTGLRLVIRCTPAEGEPFELTMTATAAATRLVGVR